MNSASGGSCEPRFAAVAEEFERNFAERGEVGASVCVTVDGEPVVDLWGGTADPAAGRPWAEDTVTTVMSSTKGAAALCAHRLVAQGKLELDAPVMEYWPEFAQKGKEAITVRMILNHTTGLPHVRSIIPDGGVADYELMVGLVEQETPYWEPGTRQAYQGLTFGWLIGEVVRRVSGVSIGRFFAEEIAGPLGLDFWIGVPPEEERRVAPLLPAPPPDPDDPHNGLLLTILSDPGCVAGQLLLNNGNWMMEPGARRYWTTEIPAAGGVTNARGLAGLYRPLCLGGSVDGVDLVGEVDIARMGSVSSATAIDGTLTFGMRFGLGYHKSVDNRASAAAGDANCIMSEEAFGHCGAGGSVGFADPRARMSFGYAMNQMGNKMMPDARAQSMIDATYRALGYRTNEPGCWI